MKPIETVTDLTPNYYNYTKTLLLERKDLDATFKAYDNDVKRLYVSMYIPPKRSRSCHLSDAVHGQVLQPGICLAIMDTCEFNRLRKIQQLGLCSRVFKDATHNRFSHSVGVSHLAGKFATQLNEQLKREGANESIVASERDIRCVQIAGLCHDLGHAPFSHVFEKVLRNIGVPLGEQHGEWNHEEMGVQMLTYLMTKNNIKWEEYDHNEEEDMKFIRECIVGVPGSIVQLPK